MRSRRHELIPATAGADTRFTIQYLKVGKDLANRRLAFRLAVIYMNQNFIRCGLTGAGIFSSVANVGSIRWYAVTIAVILIVPFIGQPQVKKIRGNPGQRPRPCQVRMKAVAIEQRLPLMPVRNLLRPI